MKTGIHPLKYYIQRVIPQVYEDTLSHNELLKAVIDKLNETVDEFNKYFSEDITVHVSHILDEWNKDGTMKKIINEEIFTDLNNGLSSLTTKVGNLPGLSTTEKQDLVKAINEVYGRGNLSASNLLGSKIELVAGVIRQDKDDPTKWEFINDEGHIPTGVNVNSLSATDDTLSFTMSKNYKRVISLVATGDEDMTQRLGATMGASVGTNAIFLKGNVNFRFYGHVSVSGSSINLSIGSGSITNETPTYSAGTGRMTIPHLFCPGRHAKVAPWFSKLDSETYFMPVIEDVLDTHFTVRFIDMRTGLPYVGALTTKMGFTFEKTYKSSIPFNKSDLGLHRGNIWFVGMFEV